MLVARLVHVEVELIVEGVVAVDGVEVVVPVGGDIVYFYLENTGIRVYCNREKGVYTISLCGHGKEIN